MERRMKPNIIPIQWSIKKFFKSQRTQNIRFKLRLKRKMKRWEKKKFAQICMKRKNLPFTICHPFFSILFWLHSIMHGTFVFLYLYPSLNLVFAPFKWFSSFPRTLFPYLFVYSLFMALKIRCDVNCVRRQMLLKDENKKRHDLVFFFHSEMRFGVVFS